MRRVPLPLPLLLMIALSISSLTSYRQVFTTALRRSSSMSLGAAAAGGIGGDATVLEAVEKADVDDRRYKQFFLNNGIPVTVVQDPKSEKASASLAVKVGAAADPLPGIAHITEHAVFLGSKKYPVENAYKDFLNKNGGGSNAGTGMEQTTYKFYVNSEAFPHALDIFSQFFKEPSFDREAMKREIMAVDAEDSKNRILDSRRMLQVLKHLMDPAATAYSKFSTGNLQTLSFGDIDRFGDTLTDTIRHFHRTYYTPDRMAVALVGPQSLEELSALAEQSFADITAVTVPTSTSASTSPGTDTSPSLASLSAEIAKVISEEKEMLAAAESLSSGSSAATTTMPPVFRPYLMERDRAETAGETAEAVSPRISLLKLRPVKDVRDLAILWQLPSTRGMYLTNPCHLLGFLLRDRGVGSIFVQLQDRGWATGVSAGTRSTFANEFTLYQAGVQLTEEGLQHWEGVVDIVFAYLEVVAQASDEQLLAIWEEMKAINALEFKFQEKGSAYDTAPHIASNMLDYPLQHIVSAGWRLEDLSLSQFRRFLALLANDRAVLMLQSPSFTHLPSDDSKLVEPLVQALVQDEDKARMHVRLERKMALSLDEDPLSVSGTGGAATATVPVQLVEPYYGVTYELSKVPAPAPGARKHLSATSPPSPPSPPLALPLLNPFICYDILAEAVPPLSEEEAASAALKLRSPAPRNILLSPRTSFSVSATGAEEGEGAAVETAATSRLWHSTDEIFRQPRSILYFEFQCPSLSDGHPVNSLLNSLYSQATASSYHQARQAGLDFSLGFSRRGVQLTLQGFGSETLLTLAKNVAKEAADEAFWAKLLLPAPKVDGKESGADNSLFGNVKERLLRNMRSWNKERPDSQADTLLSYLLQEGTWLPGDRLAAAEAMDRSFVKQRLQEVFPRTNTEGHPVGRGLVSSLGYHHGSARFDEAAVQGVFEAVEGSVRAPGLGASDPVSATTDPATSTVGFRARRLPSSTHTVVALPGFNSEDPNNAYVVHVQTEVTSPRNAAMSLLLRRLLSEPAFSELRTQKQLGYIVSLYPSGYGRGLSSLRGFTVKVLSKRFDPLEMEREVAAFLTGTAAALVRALDEETIATSSASIIKSLLDPPTSQAEEAGEFWGAISNTMPFDWSEQVIAALQTMTLLEVQTAAEQWLGLGEESTAGLMLPKTSVALMLFGNQHLTQLEEYKARIQTQTNIETETETETVKLAEGEADAAVAETPATPYFETTQVLWSLEELTAFRGGLAFEQE